MSQYSWWYSSVLLIFVKVNRALNNILMIKDISLVSRHHQASQLEPHTQYHIVKWVWNRLDWNHYVPEPVVIFKYLWYCLSTVWWKIWWRSIQTVGMFICRSACCASTAVCTQKPNTDLCPFIAVREPNLIHHPEISQYVLSLLKCYCDSFVHTGSPSPTDYWLWLCPESRAELLSFCLDMELVKFSFVILHLYAQRNLYTPFKTLGSERFL